LQIVADILAIARGGAKRTQIMYQANLSYRLLCRYLSEALDAGLLNFGSSAHYVLTQKGKEFLRRHGEYSKHCRSVEEHLNNINSERDVLERMCSNLKMGDNKNNCSRIIIGGKKLKK